MTTARVVVLGALAVEGPAGSEPRVSAATQQLIALLVAAGKDGITKDQLAEQMWPEDLPQSWKSSLRNRITQLRKLLGNDGVLNRSGRYQLGTEISVDSWELLAAPLQHHRAAEQQFAFLQGDPFAGIPLTPLLLAHQQQIVAARAARIQQIVANTKTQLAPFALQTLRTYQLSHVLDSATTQQTVLAHFQANDDARAREIIHLTQQTAEQNGVNPLWVTELDDLDSSVYQLRRTGDQTAAGSDASDTPTADSEAEANRIRANIFASAAENNDWAMALEIAMSGLPNAINIHGDLPRLELLKAIPIDSLEPSQQFILANLLAQHHMLVQQEDQARTWSLRARELVQTHEEALTAFHTGGLVGDAADEREPQHLPEGFDLEATTPMHIRLLQLSTVSHLERSPAAVAAKMVAQVDKLVEASGDPHRRWHALLMKSMLTFVAGDWARAVAAAEQAHQYGALFSVANNDSALLGQRLNPAWVHADFVPDEIARPASSGPIDEAMYQTLADDGNVDAFIDSFNCESRAFYTVPVLALAAHKITSSVNKNRVAKRLQPRSGTSAILGAGAMHFGPVDRALALLSSDSDERDAHLAAAIQTADLQQTRVWQVLCRLEHFETTNDAKLFAEARGLATTPELQLLVSKFGSGK